MIKLFVQTLVIGIAYYIGYMKGRHDLRAREALKEYFHEGKQCQPNLDVGAIPGTSTKDSETKEQIQRPENGSERKNL